MGSTKNNSIANRVAIFLEKKWLIIFILIMLVAAFVRFFGITKASIWHDEGFTAMLSGRGWLDIWQGSGRDVHPPLYYELLHLWQLLFGKSALALRSFSAICGLLVVTLGYLVSLKISKKYSVAAIAGLILALNPFLIRYSQEARMYGVLGVFLLLAMLGLIMIVDNLKSWQGYVLYVVGVSAGLYTHYFTVLVVASFWLYVLTIFLRSKKNRISLLFDWRWWLANIIAIALFIPWLPSMIKQLTRAQGLGWLQKTSLNTFNDTLWQFFTFTDARKIWSPVYWLVPIIALLIIIYLAYKDETKQRFLRLVTFFSLVPLFLAIAVSLLRPIYHERYFVFSAIGLCIMLAFVVYYAYKKSFALAILILGVVLVLQIIGIRNVNAQASHQMAKVMQFVNTNFQKGDAIVSGELYTYFDGSYYNDTGKTFLLYTAAGQPNGYGESGLIYDKNVYLDSYSQLPPGRVWIIGKTGEHDYFSKIPASWELLGTTTAGYSVARLYQIQ